MEHPPQAALQSARLARRELEELGRVAGSLPELPLKLHVRPAAAAIVAPELPMSLYNRIVGLGMEAPTDRDELEELVGLYPSGSPLLVELLPGARPAELADWLEALGLQPLGACAVSRLCAEAVEGAVEGAVEEAVEGAVEPAPSEIRVRRVRDGEAEAFAHITVVASGWPEAATPLVAAAVATPSSRCYLGWRGDEAVAAASMTVAFGVARLARAATLPEHRGRGAHAALIARRIADARREGCRAVLTENHDSDPESRNPSFRNLRRAGFRPVAWRRNFGRHVRSCTL